MQGFAKAISAKSEKLEFILFSIKASTLFWSFVSLNLSEKTRKASCLHNLSNDSFVG